MTPPAVVGPASLALRDVQDGPTLAFVVLVAHPADDVASVRVDFRELAAAVGASEELSDDEVGPALDAMPWKLRDRLAVG